MESDIESNIKTDIKANTEAKRKEIDKKNGGEEKEKPMTPEEFLELIAPFTSLADVPPEELARRLRERMARTAAEKYIGPNDRG